MLFSSMIFLWLFLPFVLVVNLVLPIRLSNLFLLAMSFIFYAWGEQEYIWLLLLSLAVNYAGAMGMEAVRGSGHDAGTAGADAGADGAAAMSDRQTTSGASKQTLITPDKLLLVALVAVNLGFLGYFKYFDFLTGLVNKLAGGTKEPAAAGGHLILHFSDDLLWGGCVPWDHTGREKPAESGTLHVLFP